MKRIFLLILAIVVGLSFCACGEGDADSKSKKYSKYEDIIDNLEKGKYNTAIDLIEEMANKNSNNSDGSVSSNSESSTKSSTEASAESEEPSLTPAQISWQKDAVGTWIPNKDATKDGHTGFVINEDGTCSVDDKNYVWKMGFAVDSRATIDIFDEQAQVFSLTLINNADYGYKFANLYVCTDNNTLTTDGTYYRSQDYTVVEITNDNWTEYFEIKELSRASENAFGEISDLICYTYLRLKDEYGAVNGDLSSGGVEHKYVSTCQDVTVDTANLTYTPVGDVLNTTIHSSISDLENSTDCSGERYFGSTIASFWVHDINKDSTDTVWRPMSIEILRIQCTLHIINQ